MRTTASPWSERSLRILHTNLAEDTYAEILDGMPMADTYRDFFLFLANTSVGEPRRSVSGLPREGSQIQDYLRHSDLTVLPPCKPENLTICQISAPGPYVNVTFIDLSKTLLAFQDAESSSRQFYLRLLELIAHEKWRNEPLDKHTEPWNTYRPPIAFTHVPYKAFEQYPHGLADVAAYWAEARIFGGIMVFDRGETESECREVYMHACRKSSTRTLYALTSEQFDQLIHFLLDNDNLKAGERPDSWAQELTAPPCPLPIVATRENRWRWDPWDAFARFHIFRDRYERKVADSKPKFRQRSHRVSDWPELGDQMLLDHWDYERRQGGYVDQKAIDSLERSIKMVTPSSPLWPGEYHYRDEQAREQTENE